MHTATRTPPHATTAKDAIALLKADQEAVGHLFAEYERTHSPSNKQALVAELCTALAVQSQIEEEILYPEALAVLPDPRMVPVARVQLAGIRHLVAQIEGVEPGGEWYDARVKVLSDCVKHHVKGEQADMFPKLRAAGLDLAALGTRMAARKASLMAARR